MYRERPSRIAGAIAWMSDVGDDEIRVLPDACIDLIWNDDALIIAGPDTCAQVFAGPRWSRLHGLRFPPGFAPRVLGLPADELTNQRVPLDDVWPSTAVAPLIDTLASSSDALRALERIAVDHSRAAPGDELVDHVVALAREEVDVATIADTVGLSDRQLHRRCCDSFGYGPKTLTRILRMTRALDLARSGLPFAETAITAGYADQPHLAREVKRLTGLPLGRLLGREVAGSPVDD